MAPPYNTRSASQGLGPVEDTPMAEAGDSQGVLPENQEAAVQAPIGAAGNVATPNTTDSSGATAPDPADVLQKEIDEISERRRIALLQETLRKARAEEAAGFCAPPMFDGTMTLPIRPESNAELEDSP